VNFSPTQDQIKALEEIKEWFNGRSIPEPFITLGGYAGTGKTELIKYLPAHLNLLPPQVAYLAFTGKAVDVMKQRGVTDPQTMHKFIYNTSFDEAQGVYIHNKRTDPVTQRLLIIDEASMVPEEMFNELIYDLKGNFKTIFVGDHGQLPPIGGKFNLMEKPDLKLTQIHRQAHNNPIIALSEMIRKQDYSFLDRKQNAINGDIGYAFGTHHRAFERDTEESFKNNFADHTYIVSRNVDRIKFNTTVRQALFGDTKALFEKDEKIIFLENNSRDMVYNGMTAFVHKTKKVNEYTHWLWTKDDPNTSKTINITALNNPKPVPSYEFVHNLKRSNNKQYGYSKADFGANVDYGYCLTCHKAQGSQFDIVFLSISDMDKFIWKENYSRWLYTAVTRTVKRLHFI
jgi:exodeoxyribonuclease V